MATTKTNIKNVQTKTDEQVNLVNTILSQLTPELLETLMGILLEKIKEMMG